MKYNLKYAKISKTSSVDFYQWLKGKSGKAVTAKLSRPDVVDALFEMKVWKEKYPSDIKRSVIVPEVLKLSKHLPVLCSFRKIYEKNNVPILAPYAYILSAISGVDTQDDTDTIAHDLARISSEYNIDTSEENETNKKKYKTPALTKHEKQKILFYYIYRNLAQEISEAFMQVGRDNMADIVKTTSILAVPDRLMAMLNLDIRDMHNFYQKDGEKIAKKIYRKTNPEENENTYNIARDEILLGCGKISPDSYDRYRSPKSNVAFDFSELQMKRIPISSSSWVSANAIVTASFFIASLYKLLM